MAKKTKKTIIQEEITPKQEMVSEETVIEVESEVIQEEIIIETKPESISIKKTDEIDLNIEKNNTTVSETKKSISKNNISILDQRFFKRMGINF